MTNSDQFVWGPLLFSAGARWHNADKTKTLLADQGGRRRSSGWST